MVVNDIELCFQGILRCRKTLKKYRPTLCLIFIFFTSRSGYFQNQFNIFINPPFFHQIVSFMVIVQLIKIFDHYAALIQCKQFNDPFISTRMNYCQIDADSLQILFELPFSFLLKRSSFLVEDFFPTPINDRLQLLGSHSLTA